MKRWQYILNALATLGAIVILAPAIFWWMLTDKDE